MRVADEPFARTTVLPRVAREPDVIDFAVGLKTQLGQLEGPTADVALELADGVVGGLGADVDADDAGAAAGRDDEADGAGELGTGLTWSPGVTGAGGLG
jgi:hypothetical protein